MVCCNGTGRKSIPVRLFRYLEVYSLYQKYGYYSASLRRPQTEVTQCPECFVYLSSFMYLLNLLVLNLRAFHVLKLQAVMVKKMIASLR